MLSASGSSTRTAVSLKVEELVALPPSESHLTHARASFLIGPRACDGCDGATVGPGTDSSIGSTVALPETTLVKIKAS